MLTVICCPPPAACDGCGDPDAPLVRTTYCPQPEEGDEPQFGGFPCIWTCPDCSPQTPITF